MFREKIFYQSKFLAPSFQKSAFVECQIKSCAKIRKKLNFFFVSSKTFVPRLKPTLSESTIFMPGPDTKQHFRLLPTDYAISMPKLMACSTAKKNFFY